MNKESTTINRVEYIPVDTPFEAFPNGCSDCDIYKARPPQNMSQLPLCCDAEYKSVNQSCCLKLRQKINRIWKIKSV